ncbi:MAG: hypothetical protein ABIO73_12750 [Polaromonas sp.]
MPPRSLRTSTAKPANRALWSRPRSARATEWSSNTLLRFDPGNEKFSVITLPRPAAGIRQLLGRHGEVWLPESGTGFISVLRTG